MLTANEIEKAFSAGSEVVVVSADKDYDSAIWWVSDGVVCAFCRAFGVVEREELTPGMAAHTLASFAALENMSLFIRGYRD